MAENRLRLLLAEDNAPIRECLRLVLEPEYEVVASLDNGPEVLQKIEDFKPDILLLDISLPGMSGLNLARQLRRIGNTTRIIFLTGHAERAYVEEAARVGVEGYVLKNRAQSELVRAIQQVSEGRSYVSPEVRKKQRLDINVAASSG